MLVRVHGLHEWMHNWYHGLLGTNESLYRWMDEGFTSYAEEQGIGFSGITIKALHMVDNYMRVIIHWLKVEKKNR